LNFVTGLETTKTPKATDSVPTKTPLSDLLTIMTPSSDSLSIMTLASDLVEPVTGSETTKTPKTTDLVPTKTPATDLVELVTGSETTKTPASDSLPTMTPATDLVPTKPGSDLVSTKTVSDLVDSIPTKMSATNYFYEASSWTFSYVKNTIFNMVLGTPPWSDSKVLKPPVSEKETSKHSENDTTATAPPDAL
jgi:hypothetical protein